MFLNYWVTAIRNFLNEKVYSLINVVGLCIGMTCALLIGLFVWDELSYDNFHLKKNLYRVALNRTFPANSTFWAVTPTPLAEVLTNEYPEVESATRIFKLTNDVRVRIGEDLHYERQVLAADSNFFDFFGIRLLHGSAKEVLRRKNTVVLTETTAMKYFNTTDVVGKTIAIFSDTTLYEITGVSENVPHNCHFTYDMLLAFTTFQFSESTSWASYTVHSYVSLDNASFKNTLEEKFPELVKQYFGPQVETILGKSYDDYVAAGNHHYYHLQPVESIHLHSNYQQELKPNGDIQNVYFFSVVCFFLLFIASVNFINLSTARSFKRAKEIGVRKVHGSSRRQLIFQFLMESTLTCLVALTISVMAVYFLLPLFNALTAKEISLQHLSIGQVVMSILLILLANGLMAGIYPAFVLSSLKPISILKNNISYKRSAARNILVAIQFSIAVVLVLGTLVIFEQVNFLKSKKLGFAKDRILVIERPNLLQGQRQAFNEEIRLIPGVLYVSNTSEIPGRPHNGGTFQVIGAEATERINHSNVFCDFHLINTLGLEVIAGRDFSEDIKSDSLAMIVNESLVDRVGWKTPQEAIGQKIRTLIDINNPYEIIGVVKDFNYHSLHSSIEPIAFYGFSSSNFNPAYTAIQFSEKGNPLEIAKQIEHEWNRFLPGESFDYFFLSDEYERLYRQEERFGSIFTLFAGLAIVIASIGVIGLSAFMANQRVKEIGIRKTLGASVPQLVLLLAKDFVKLMLIANLLAAPIAWYGINSWLEKYPYHTHISMWIFPFTAILMCVLVLLSISWQSWRAAVSNPVKSLRGE